MVCVHAKRNSQKKLLFSKRIFSVGALDWLNECLGYPNRLKCVLVAEITFRKFTSCPFFILTEPIIFVQISLRTTARTNQKVPILSTWNFMVIRCDSLQRIRQLRVFYINHCPFESALFCFLEKKNEEKKPYKAWHYVISACWTGIALFDVCVLITKNTHL